MSAPHESQGTATLDGGESALTGSDVPLWYVVSKYSDGERVLENGRFNTVESAEVFAAQVRRYREDQNEAPNVYVERAQ